jgi:hypothetical protein
VPVVDGYPTQFTDSKAYPKRNPTAETDWTLCFDEYGGNHGIEAVLRAIDSDADGRHGGGVLSCRR